MNLAKKDHARLLLVAEALRDKKLMELAEAKTRCAKIRSALEALSPSAVHAGAADFEDIPHVELHNLWRLHRRRELNEALAREMAGYQTVHQGAVSAFVRAEMLSTLMTKTLK